MWLFNYKVKRFESSIPKDYRFNHYLVIDLCSDHADFAVLFRYLQDNDFRFTHKNPFTNMSLLANLQLSSNEINDIPDDAFDGCTSLTTLWVLEFLVTLWVLEFFAFTISTFFQKIISDCYIWWTSNLLLKLIL